MPEFTVPVLIVGGGPVGLAASICLSRFGVESLLVEEHPSTTTHPKATVVNTRTFELFRQWGIDAAVRAGGLPPERSRFIVWATTLTGFELGRLDLGAPAPGSSGDPAEMLRQASRFSPALSGICPQDVYEPILREKAASYPAADVRFHTALESFRNDPDGVDAIVRSLETGRRQSVRAHYLLACDGAASPVRERLGIRMLGPDRIGSILNVYFHADLRPYIAGREGPLYWIVNADVPGVFIALDNAERWLLNTPFAAGTGETVERLDDDACRAKVRRAVGDPGLKVEIRSIDPWIMRSQVAERYRSDSIFLLGDAAHRFPPTGGFGMNTGVQDAHNLAWKIAGVLQGWAEPRLLDTYEVERRPVAQQNADQSHKNARQMPSPRRGAGDTTNPLARIEEDSPEGAALRELVASGIGATREHFSATGQAKGYVYSSVAIAAEPLSAPEEASTIQEYRPSARPGSVAPHCWVRCDGERTSLLDLFGSGFTLLTGPRGEAWERAARRARRTSLPRLDVHVIGRGVPLDDGIPSDWCTLYGVAEDGAVLVRPDGHVAWRARTVGEDAEGALRNARALALGFAGNAPERPGSRGRSD